MTFAPLSNAFQRSASDRRVSSDASRASRRFHIVLLTTAPNEEDLVIIVAGHVVVDPAERDDYLSGFVEVVRQARQTPGCLDFSLSADLIEPGRINVFERWESQAALEAFRGSGPSDEQGAAIVSAEVAEYDVTSERNLDDAATTLVFLTRRPRSAR
jgi:quinol monooxygenase YgiN